jgi:hypothetical protein
MLLWCLVKIYRPDDLLQLAATTHGDCNNAATRYALQPLSFQQRREQRTAQSTANVRASLAPVETYLAS